MMPRTPPHLLFSGRDPGGGDNSDPIDDDSFERAPREPKSGLLHDEIIYLLEQIVESSREADRAVQAGKSLTKPNKEIVIDRAANICKLAEKCKKLVKRGNWDADGDNMSLSIAYIDEKTTLAIKETIKETTLTMKESIKKEMSQFAKSLLSTATCPSTDGPTPTYASVARAGKAAPGSRVETRKDIHKPAIIVTVPQAENGHQALDQWRSCVSFKSCNYAPINTQTFMNNKIRVEFENSDQRDATLMRIPPNAEVKAEAARSLLPMILIKGIHRDTPSNELINIVKTQNDCIRSQCKNDEDFKLCFLKRNRNPKLYNAVVRVSPAIWKAIVGLERLNIDHQRVHFEEISPLRQCFDCLQFGHTRAYCKNEQKPCSYCSSPTHRYQDCPVKNDPLAVQCYNCTCYNNKYKVDREINHSATSNKCPRLRAMIDIISRKIQYE